VADFAWPNLAEQTIAVYERVWKEFLTSYWADATVWPVSPGAEERAKELQLDEKALTGVPIERPRVPVAVPVPAPRPEEDEDEAFWSPAF
jgi:hypothetical protein